MMLTTIEPTALTERNAERRRAPPAAEHGGTTPRDLSSDTPRCGAEGRGSAPLGAGLSQLEQSLTALERAVDRFGRAVDARYRIADEVARVPRESDPLAIAARRAGLTRRDYLAAVETINARAGR